MATKTITIMNDAYELLKRNKGKGESFSDVIRKKIGGRTNIMEFAGIWKDVPKEDIDEMKKIVEELRKPSERLKELFR